MATKKKAMKKVVAKAKPKPVVRDKNGNIKTTRTELARLLDTAGGQFMTTIHIGADNKPHVINGIRMKVQDNPLGYVKVWSRKAKEQRFVNKQTLCALSIHGEKYIAPRKKMIVSI